jgi:hypothetical protein
VPAEQLVHWLDPAFEYVPWAQGVAAKAARPVSAQKKPASQLLQLVDPLDDWYCPAPHGLHEDDPSPEYVPEGQLAQLT